MTNYFAIALVAISAFLAAGPAGAYANGNQASNRANERRIPVDATRWVEESGTASYYGPAFHGHLAANGSRFNQEALTAAHPWLPFGTKVKVTLASTGRSVVVTITDRLYFSHRVVDLSVAAARQLGMINTGVAKVKLAPV